MPRFVANVGEWYQFSLGLPYISSNMKQAGFNVFTLNLDNEADDVVDLLRGEIDNTILMPFLRKQLGYK
jgi:hypothetical protein